MNPDENGRTRHNEGGSAAEPELSSATVLSDARASSSRSVSAAIRESPVAASIALMPLECSQPPMDSRGALLPQGQFAQPALAMPAQIASIELRRANSRT